MRRSIMSCCIVLLMCFASALTYAQGSATIGGTVTDPQGAVVAGAKITATNLATGIDRSTASTSSGEYSLSLPPGAYDLKVEAKGFTAGAARNVKLNVGDKQDFNFKLTLAGTKQTVEVTAEAP